MATLCPKKIKLEKYLIMKSKSLCLCAAIVLLSLASCKKDPATNFKNPTNLTNPFFPVAAGKKYIYEGQT